MYFNQIASNPTSDPAVRKALIQASQSRRSHAELSPPATGIRATSLVAVEPRACVYDSVAGNIPDFDVSAAKATWTRPAGPPGRTENEARTETR